MVKKQLTICALLLFAVSFAKEKTIQNGLDGYEGCSDAYLTEVGKDNGAPHGEENKLRLRGGT